MAETVTGSTAGDGLAAAAQMLHDFNLEYDEPAPPPDQLEVRLRELVECDHVTVLLARAPETGAAVGVAVMRAQPSLWSRAHEAHLAELYVTPSQRTWGTDGSRSLRPCGSRASWEPTTHTWSRASMTGLPNASTRRLGFAGPMAKAVRSCWPMSASCRPPDCTSFHRVRDARSPTSRAAITHSVNVLAADDRTRHLAISSERRRRLDDVDAQRWAREGEVDPCGRVTRNGTPWHDGRALGRQLRYHICSEPERWPRDSPAQIRSRRPEMLEHEGPKVALLGRAEGESIILPMGGLQPRSTDELGDAGA